MEKKLKINFLLKGIAVFAFVAFCLLAILAGVTLPFVSNASTYDCAVVSAESDYATASSENLDNFIPLSNAVIGTTYYGIYIPDIEKNWTATADDSPYLLRLFNFHTLDTNSNYRVFSYKQRTVRDFILKMVVDGMNRDVQTICETSTFENQYIYDNGFVLDEIVSASSVFDIYLRTSPYIGDISSYVTQIETLTAEKNALQEQLTEKQNQIDTLTAEKNALQAQLTEKQNQIDTLLADKATLQSQVDTLTSEKATLQAQLTEKQNQIDSLTAEKATLQSQVNTLTAEIETLQAQLTEKNNQIDTLTAEKNTLQNQLANTNFMTHFGNFDNLGSSDFYVNLSSDIVLPEIFYQYTNNSTPINGWFLMGSGANTEIYGLNLFDRFYYNGTQESGFLNCGFQLTIKSIPSTTMPPTYTTQCKLHFVVSDTFVWSADCDTDYNTDTKVETITNIRNGTFKVSSNYDKDTNVYKFTAPSDKLYLLNENYNKSYDTFRSYVVQQDYKKTRIPSDNALYLNGYQSASKDFYNNGYNDGVAVGEKSGYNKGFTAGDAQGYNRGVEVGGNYSFLGLFGAIFDAPIQAIFGGTTTLPAGTTITDKNGNTTTLLSSATVKRAGLLNFDIMGVNLSGFVLALFSLSILVVVIKFALGKGR